MRAILAAFVGVVIVFALGAVLRNGAATNALPGDIQQKIAPVFEPPPPDQLSHSRDRDVEYFSELETQEATRESVITGPPRRIEYGGFVDPLDPTTWPVKTEHPVEYGGFVDPQDPSTWPVVVSEPVDHGEFWDPLLPPTRLDLDSKKTEFGLFEDPEDESTWRQVVDEPIEIGSAATNEFQ